MRFQLKLISSEGKSRKTLFTLFVDLLLRLQVIFYGGVGLLKMSRVCAGGRFRKEVQSMRILWPLSSPYNKIWSLVIWSL